MPANPANITSLGVTGTDAGETAISATPQPPSRYTCGINSPCSQVIAFTGFLENVTL